MSLGSCAECIFNPSILSNLAILQVPGLTKSLASTAQEVNRINLHLTGLIQIRMTWC